VLEVGRNAVGGVVVFARADVFQPAVGGDLQERRAFATAGMGDCGLGCAVHGKDVAGIYFRCRQTVSGHAREQWAGLTAVNGVVDSHAIVFAYENNREFVEYGKIQGFGERAFFGGAVSKHADHDALFACFLGFSLQGQGPARGYRHGGADHGRGAEDTAFKLHKMHRACLAAAAAGGFAVEFGHHGIQVAAFGDMGGVATVGIGDKIGRFHGIADGCGDGLLPDAEVDGRLDFIGWVKIDQFFFKAANELHCFIEFCNFMRAYTLRNGGGRGGICHAVVVAEIHPVVYRRMDMSMLKNASVFVTGGTGMIGSALLRRLADVGVKNVFAPRHAELELTDLRAVEAYFEKHRPEYVFHLAARVGGIKANNELPADFIYVNTMMQAHIMACAARYRVTKLLFPGSACTYPKGIPQPVAEDTFMTGPVEPTNLAYATAKMNGLIMAQSFAKQHGLKVVLPMPTNTYGVGDNFDPAGGHVIPALMNRMVAARDAGDAELVMWGTGTPKREFIYVDDVADAFVHLMLAWDSPDIVNVGTGWEITIAELAHKIAEVVGYKGKLLNDTTKPDGVMRKCLNSGKLRESGWEPKVGLDEGLARMYAQHFEALA